MSLTTLLGAIGQWVADGAAWLLDQVGAVMSSTTGAQLGSSWFGARFSLMSELAASVILPMICCAVIQAIYRQSAAALLRIFLVNLPIALVVTGVAVELVRIGLVVTDAMSDQFLAAGGVDTRHFLAPVSTVLVAASPLTGIPGFALFLVSAFVAGAAFVLWLELVVRAAAITAAALFLPLVLAALVWPAVGHWARRLADTLAALVLSKLVIAAVLSLSAGALDGGIDGSGSVGTRFGDVVVGVALLLLSTFSPFVLLRLVPAVEAGAVSHLEAGRHRLRQGVDEAFRPPNAALERVTRRANDAAQARALLSQVGEDHGTHGTQAGRQAGKAELPTGAKQSARGGAGGAVGIINSGPLDPSDQAIERESRVVDHPDRISGNTSDEQRAPAGDAVTGVTGSGTTSSKLAGASPARDDRQDRDA